MLVHTVLFKFTPESSDAQVQACADDARNLLAKIETVHSLYIGA